MRHIEEFGQDEAAAYPIPNEVPGEGTDSGNSEDTDDDRYNEPLISSDEDDLEHDFINLAILRSNSNKIVLPTNMIYYPGLYRTVRHPKLSVLTGSQHFTCLRVICANEPHILSRHVIPPPCQYDIETEKTLAPLYKNEQKEFITWAKTLWSKHYIRAISPKPIIESVYEAEYKVRARRQLSYPKLFTAAKPVPLQVNTGHRFNVSITSTLIAVKTSSLPIVDLPELVENFTIYMPCSVPQPCNTHPYKFILPNEHNVSTLPIVEIHRELAEFAAKNHSKYIASENALKCLVTFNRKWTIPITVCTAFTPEGQATNVIVLDSEFLQKKEIGIVRSYRACKHLLLQTLIPPPEMQRRVRKLKKKSESKEPKRRPDIRVLNKDDATSNVQPLGLLTLKEENEQVLMELQPGLSNTGWNPSLPLGLLTINETPEEFESQTMKMIVDPDNNDNRKNPDPENEGNSNQDDIESTKGYDEPTELINLKNVEIASSPKKAPSDVSMEDINEGIREPVCTCTDAIYEVTVPRSFKKMQVLNHNLNEGHNLIVHYSSKARRNFREIVLEPIVEYQLELGASELPPDRVRSLILSLILRKHSAALLVRINSSNGEIVRYDMTSTDQFISTYEDIYNEMANAIHTVLSNLDGLSPGHYLLTHEPGQGTNASLLVAEPSGEYKLCGSVNVKDVPYDDESNTVDDPPTISPMLLPFHKYHKLLPCSFTPYKYQIAKEIPKPSNMKKNHPPSNKKSKKRNKRRK